MFKSAFIIGDTFTMQVQDRSVAGIDYSRTEMVMVMGHTRGLKWVWFNGSSSGQFKMLRKDLQPDGQGGFVRTGTPVNVSYTFTPCPEVKQ